MSRDFPASRLRDMSTALKDFSKYLDSLYKYKQSQLEFKSTSEFEEAKIISRYTPESYYRFQFFDKGLEVVYAGFKIDYVNGIIHKINCSKHSYHINFYGFRPSFCGLRRYEIPCSYEHQIYGNYDTLELALIDFKRGCLDLLAQIFGSSYERLEQYLFGQNDLDIF